MAIALIPISTLQQYFEAAHSLPSEKQKPFYLSVLHDFGRFDLAKAMQHLYEIRSDRWIRIRPEDFEDLMEIPPTEQPPPPKSAYLIVGTRNGEYRRFDI